MTSYKHTLDFLYTRLPMYQRTGPAAYKDTLENTLVLDELFGFPHRNFKSVHVAGTNGKGSSSHLLASVLQEAGYKVGLYTSPHLIDFRERIKINGEMISEEAVVAFVDQFIKMNETAQLEPSFFEITVAMAFDYFRNQKVDIAMIEVGLGGRLDSTNIIRPEVSLITNISLDHTALLGNTIEKIALEKAGIIKESIPVVVSESNNMYNHVFEATAREKQSPIYFADQQFQSGYSMRLPEGKQVFYFNKIGQLAYPDLKMDLLGNYQRKNAAGVLKTIELLQEKGWTIENKAIYEGFSNASKNTGLRGRWEVVGNNPLMVCDTAHNAAGLTDVAAQIEATPWKALHFVLGMVNDKNLDQALAVLPKEANYLFTQAKIPRALPAPDLAAQAATFGLRGQVIDSVPEAVAKARSQAQPEDLIFIGGSTFVVADYFS
ncbi:bifunctional folylpolyglutamate synthase/dihydrofolate synthase [Sunxiuqinia dokdonensis]|uniref:Dihydrofolate synthase/folylpolyglutamate synthase n=1 Tax=Sunxiuqinia dokdonensis TaxID=1409788 RepID=A0A0L8VC98_9BACT|nr:folylpolyglutamate synthase/dihydrofolate synthase family protein [Sunxiuqinia dokdonensis]KOH45797.1 tetrahydrofolate synthase [Sunxiuqinia dokdonensis]